MTRLLPPKCLHKMVNPPVRLMAWLDQRDNGDPQTTFALRVTSSPVPCLHCRRYRPTPIARLSGHRVDSCPIKLSQTQTLVLILTTCPQTVLTFPPKHLTAALSSHRQPNPTLLHTSSLPSYSTLACTSLEAKNADSAFKHPVSLTPFEFQLSVKY